MSLWPEEDARNAKWAAPLLAADLRVVSFDWVSGGPLTEHIVHVSELPAFLEASKRLHHTPGVNPHVTDRGNRASKLWRIRVAPMQAHGPYWWAQRKLGVVPSAGARIFRGGLFETAFVDHARIPEEVD